jgi:hypothetical protein
VIVIGHKDGSIEKECKFAGFFCIIK